MGAKNTRKTAQGTFLILAIIIIVTILWMTGKRSANITDLSSTAFEEMVTHDDITNVVIIQNKQVPTGKVIIQIKSGNATKEYHYYTSDVNKAQKTLDAAQVKYSLQDVPKDSVFMNVFFPVILSVGMVLFLMMFLNRGAAGGSKAMSFGKSRAVMSDGKSGKITFNDVAGLKEEKEELWEVVDFLKNPIKYRELGARIPKGILLVGPPGTGKTLLAKAVAGEAGVPFFSISGSDFVELFVGVGASRVRDLFQDAKGHSPCIVFIDEIDAVARRRGTGMGGGHDEREQTLNQLLVEMDGFGVNEGIIMIAATNRVDILDPAILRPGRFDRKVIVGSPDVGEREEILKVHAKNKAIGDDVDLHSLASATSGFSGADLENLLNEGALLAARHNRKFMIEADIKEAFVKVGIGTEKRSRIITPKEREITAYHEAGHAILFHLLENVGPVYSVSIIPTGMAGGYTMPLPENNGMYKSKSEMLDDITVSFGGRVAESLIFDEITTGASGDIKQATNEARAMITKYGMSEVLGPINYDDDSDDVFIGKDLMKTNRGYGDGIADEIDKEVHDIINSCYKKAHELIVANMEVLHKTAKLLLEKEKITREEFEALF
ncbi:MAG: ATP-dependent zinc metalloprotease FtsH [Lachnospiraceae bacterium]|nr:ATP-dependent zinc metalloprotease FtsH [Lachnospiraceae bacterium]